MSQILHQELLQIRGRAKAWLEWRDFEGFSPMFGICQNLPRKKLDCGRLLDLMTDWPNGSGVNGFPVPHPVKDPVDAFFNSSLEQMWNPEYEYARNRWALLEWLIEQIASEAALPVAADCVEVAA